jgi:hypothetical protein
LLTRRLILIILCILLKDEECFDEAVIKYLIGKSSELLYQLDELRLIFKNYSFSIINWCESKLVLNFDSFGIIDIDDNHERY